MAYNFPNSPANGDTYDKFIYNGVTGVWDVQTPSVFPYYVGTTPPTGAKDNSGWFNSENGTLYIKYNDGSSTQWVATSGAVTQAAIKNLSNLTDINITAIADGQTLKYNATSQKWENYNYNNDVVKLNPQTISANLDIPSGYNGVTAGPITVANGITVTIANGSAWSIV